MSDDTDVCCRTCLFATEFDDKDDDDRPITKLACKRFPPQFVVYGDQALAMNPIVEPVNFCGEHCSKPEGRKPS